MTGNQAICWLQSNNSTARGWISGGSTRVRSQCPVIGIKKKKQNCQEKAPCHIQTGPAFTPVNHTQGLTACNINIVK